MKLTLKTLIAVLAIVAATVAGATTIQPLSIEDMAQASSDIVQGAAVQSWSAWDAEHRHIYTYTRFRVDSAYKGGTVQEVVVKQLGGSDGKVQLHVAGVRQFVNGENALLFLTPSATGDGSRLVVGLMQGNFRLERTMMGEWMASNGVPRVSAATAGNIVEFRGATMRLTDLQARIRKAVGR